MIAEHQDQKVENKGAPVRPYEQPHYPGFPDVQRSNEWLQCSDAVNDRGSSFELRYRGAERSVLPDA